ncbi:hemicentin-1-like [Dreissena polymorpha]|uniref:hemicentin-1-like n=1 Tax=Dreissena polymorpha TaxID=45954 RepID=UPI002264F89F|nr:hemicentin-1-like [Dreissena polymorpha]
MKASDNYERYGRNENYLNLEILTPPTAPTISYNGNHILKSITIIEGKDYDFYCTSVGKPSPQINWQLLNRTTEHHVLQIRNVGALQNTTIKCCAKNHMIPAVGVPEHGSECKHLNLNVLHKPKFAFNDAYAVTENDSFNITCTKQNINTVITWLRQGDEDWSESHNTIYWTEVRRENAGNYTCKLRYLITDSFNHSISGDSEHSFHLNVEYPASVINFEAVGHSDSVVVNENKSVTFRCNATGNPSPTIRIKNNNRVLKQRNAISLGNKEIMTCAHTGKYSCYARNIINEEESTSKDIDVFVMCSPRPASNMLSEFNFTTNLHLTVILNFTVIAYPEPQPSDYVWKKCDVEESNGTFQCFPLVDERHFNVSIVDLTSYLTISDFTQHDIGRYMLSVENGVGDAWNQTFFVWIKAASSVTTHNSDVLLPLIGAGGGALMFLATTVLVCVCRKRKMRDNSVANKRQINVAEEVKVAVRSCKTGKKPGVDNVHFELIKHGGVATTSEMTALCHRIWEEKKWSKEWTQSLLFHNFIDFTKAFDRVWNDGVWPVMKGFITEGLVQIIKELYGNASSAALLNGKQEDFFRTSVGVRHGCLLSIVLYNLFLDTTMQETLHGHHTSISISGRPISILRFADEIDLMSGTSSEFKKITNRLYERTGAYGMEVSTEKIMVNIMTNTSSNITMNGEKLLSMGMLEISRRRGRQKKNWMDNVNEGTFLPMDELHTAHNRTG